MSTANMPPMTPGVNYFTTVEGEEVRIAEIVSGYRVRFDATNWQRFDKPESMMSWIRSLARITSDTGKTLTGEQFLALPEITSGAIWGDCKIIRGVVYNLA